MIKRTACAVVLLSFLFAACTQDYAGGAGTETTNGIVATALSGDGSPAAHVLVRVVEARDWYVLKTGSLDVVADSGYTDASGRIRFHDLPVSRYNLIFTGTEEGALEDSIETRADSTVSAGEVRLRKYAAFHGTVASRGCSALTTCIGGTHYEVPVDDSGGFDFPALVAGDYAVFLRVDSAGSRELLRVAELSLAPAAVASDNGLTAVYRGMMLDNFNDGDRFSFLDKVTGGSTWFAYDDTRALGNSDLEPPGVLADFTAAVTEGSGWDGRGVHVKFIMGGAITNPFASITCVFSADTNAFYDLTGLTAISFYCRGNDSVRVNLASHAVKNYPDQSKGGDCGITLALTPQWRKVTVTADQLRPPAGSQQEADGLAWPMVRDSIFSVVFGSWAHPGDTVDLYLDEVILHGVNEDIFIREKE
jgi:hypothetical protein